MIKYIADTHFGHENVIRFDNRPFKTIEEMDEEMIRRWNENTDPEDTVYILGDFSWYKAQKTIEILKRLNGKKTLIRGNHDRINNEIEKCFEEIRDYMEIADNGVRVIMSHQFMPFWNAQHRNSVHLFAHIHNNQQENEICEEVKERLRQMYGINAEAYNVGCMMPWMGLVPRTLEEIREGYRKENKK